MADDEDDQSFGNVLERGAVRFLYRPKVGEEYEEAGKDESLDDVQRFYMVLAPRGRSLYRLLVIGRKRLPDVDDHERNWGFVEAISDSESGLEQGLQEKTYETKTRGKRVVPAARPAGDGRYVLAELEGSLRFMYRLLEPRKTNAIQRAFNIAPEAAFVMSIKNPDKSSPPGAGLPEHEEAATRNRCRRASAAGASPTTSNCWTTRVRNSFSSPPAKTRCRVRSNAEVSVTSIRGNRTERPLQSLATTTTRRPRERPQRLAATSAACIRT
jgi:hypothetical protein